MEQGVIDQGRIASGPHAVADGDDELGNQEGGETLCERINSDPERHKNGAEDQRFSPADDIGQVSGGDLHDQYGQGIRGLYGEDLGLVQVVGLVIGDQDGNDQPEFAQQLVGINFPEVGPDVRHRFLIKKR